MSAMSPGIIHAHKPQSSLTTGTLQHPDVTQALETFRLLVQSCYGPAGCLKTIQNSCGGQVTVTSSSSVIVRLLSVSKPLLRLMLAAVEGHIANCSDGGLFCALLMTNLVKTCCQLDIHPVLCGSINELMLEMCVEFLNSDESCRVRIDVGDAEVMLSLVRSVVGTKPACGLSERERDIICSLTLQAFLHALPSSVGQTLRIPAVKYILVEGKTPSDSLIMDGVLIESPQIPSYANREINILRQDDGSIRVALFNTSLAGGGEDFPDIHLETTGSISPDDVSLSQLLTLGSNLVEWKTGLLACQKVVHPALKRFLRRHGVLTIDRLSVMHISSVQTITGARMLGALPATFPEDAMGYLENLTHCVIYGKSYLLLQNSSHPICTYVLCNRTEASLEELKTVCSAANHVLALTLSQPLALPGAGCFEACLAAHLKRQIGVIESEVLDDLGCSKSQFRVAAENFIHCVELVARALEHGQDSQVTDTVHHHRWLLPLTENPSDWLRQCACGMKSFEADSDWLLLGCRHQSSDRTQQLCTLKNSETEGKQPNSKKESETAKAPPPDVPVVDKRTSLVLDSFVAKLNALHVAVETANIVLRIHQTIEDGSI